MIRKHHVKPNTKEDKYNISKSIYMDKIAQKDILLLHLKENLPVKMALNLTKYFQK